MSGFLAHKALTRFLVDAVVCRLVKPEKGKTQEKWQTTVEEWQSPLTGFGTLLVGVAIARALVPKNAAEISAGMAVSWLHTTLVTAFGVFAAKAEKADTRETLLNVRNYVAGLDNQSTAAAIGRARGRGGRRGTGAFSSILPRYRNGPGLRQATAGGMGALMDGRCLFEGKPTAEQPAAGYGEYYRPGAGEGSILKSAQGEYFAQSVEGVGDYEAAGPLALLPSAHAARVVDGIRPENAEYEMRIAEAAAGVGKMPRFTQAMAGPGYRQAAAGVGEYEEADNGGFRRVSQEDDWIPRGPFQAGTKAADDTQVESEYAAGILESPGGGGIFG